MNITNGKGHTKPQKEKKKPKMPNGNPKKKKNK